MSLSCRTCLNMQGKCFDWIFFELFLYFKMFSVKTFQPTFSVKLLYAVSFCLLPWVLYQRLFGPCYLSFFFWLPWNDERCILSLSFLYTPSEVETHTFSIFQWLFSTLKNVDRVNRYAAFFFRRMNSFNETFCPSFMYAFQNMRLP